MNLEIIKNTARDRGNEVETDTTRRPSATRQSPREPTESERALITAQRRLTDAQLQVARLADHNRLLRQRVRSLARAATLQQTAERLIACITTCPYEDDEFFAIPPQANVRDHCADAEQRLHARLAALCVVDGIKATLMLSIGGAGLAAGARDWCETLRLADFVIYRAGSGRKDHARRVGTVSV